MKRAAGLRVPYVAALGVLAASTIAGATIVSALYASQPPTHIVVPPTAEPPPLRNSHVLRVCADPNNLPFSNSRGEGFENAIADVLAHDLGRTVEYFWQPQRRGFVRTTLRAGRCDVIVGVPSRFDLAQTTKPYYRSTYVFVSPRQTPPIRSFDDARLKGLRIGIQLTGEDYENPPPAHALAVRGLAEHVHGYTVYGDYSKPAPQRAVIDAVASGAIDTAIVWGPLGAYFAAREPVPLDVEPVQPAHDGPAVPFIFDISAAVRRDDHALQSALNAALMRRRAEIRRILQRFNVPLVKEN